MLSKAATGRGAPSAIVLSLAALLVPMASSAERPAKALPPLGTCSKTSIKLISQRLEDGATHRSVPNTGSAMLLKNGVYGVSYDQVAALNQSRVGDPVYTCLVKLPRHCPPGDNRGKLYTTTNLRTEKSWTLPDAEHMCGGA